MKLDILFGMLLTLLNKKTVTAQYLANKFDISVRTVYRYLSILDTNNIPIVTKSGRNGGITIYNAINLQNVYFTTDEKLTMIDLTQGLTNQNLKITLQTKLLALR